MNSVLEIGAQPAADAIGHVVKHLEASWNAGDGSAFADAFADDADFVHRYGGRIRGRIAIASLHNALLTGHYAGSINRYDVESLRLPAPNVALAHVRAHLVVPSHGLVLDALWLGVFVLEDAGWAIAAFHNTLVEPQPDDVLDASPTSSP